MDSALDDVGMTDAMIRRHVRASMTRAVRERLVTDRELAAMRANGIDVLKLVADAPAILSARPAQQIGRAHV